MPSAQFPPDYDGVDPSFSLVALLVELSNDYPGLSARTLSHAIARAAEVSGVLYPGAPISVERVEVLVRDRLDALRIGAQVDDRGLGARSAQ